ncbi:hypothetical protein [Neotamlana nanhaiensis]|nr:hypothetical protein [Tamlana nanhaiensis]
MALCHNLATTLLFVIFLAYAKKINLLKFGFFFLLCSSYFIMAYDDGFYRLILHIFRILANIFFIIHIFPKQKKVKFKTADFYIVISVLVLINLYILSSISDLVDYYSGPQNYSSLGIYTMGGMHIILAILTFKLSLNKSDVSTYFTHFVVLYIVSDILNVMAYGLQSDTLYLFNRIFYILSLYFLIFYVYKLNLVENHWSKSKNQ